MKKAVAASHIDFPIRDFVSSSRNRAGPRYLIIMVEPTNMFQQEVWVLQDSNIMRSR